ncbi:MAG: hypothetical protein UV46_C0069G0002 [Candidatus Gottesmanbacteria bacterium GW2011_GWC2_42_8]|uniref:Uncharacterized protein n=1 Tax=Candidatus Gottesmanbacteria bacterium GW2011_GWA2_43_14 TaxID=1618443 RepID=A0A0G1DFS7_9BACT|nr:MAG: hypothetical protein UV46_C0069G0002 [Candidatus Gottesmanbacteria bacterium GW2011_GWC2_42_8]KKS96467.1 MAG: hypothetical protein UV73_C0010G0052 [Candidatus Gottesmanbacteria bacterium GW2011_GWA2_43_14]
MKNLSGELIDKINFAERVGQDPFNRYSLKI